MDKIPTELYVCCPNRSSNGPFLSNAWINLTRKDTGRGLKGKRITCYLDGKVINSPLTFTDTGYYGPDDMNPQAEGLHPYYVAFAGDADFEPCKSEEIILKVDPNLSSYVSTGFGSLIMQVSPVSGEAPLTIHVSGRMKRIPYSVPLDLMVDDRTSTKTLQVVKTVMSNPDGTYSFDYTFTKPGSYAIFVNFLGDDKYRSVWSNNGRTTTIKVEGGGLPLSFDKTVTVTAKESKQFRWVLSQTEPTAPEGYARFPDLDLDFGVLGKYWAFIKTA